MGLFDDLGVFVGQVVFLILEEPQHVGMIEERRDGLRLTSVGLDCDAEVIEHENPLVEVELVLLHYGDHLDEFEAYCE